MAAAPRVVGGFKAEEDPDEEVKAMTTAVRAGGVRASVAVPRTSWTRWELSRAPNVDAPGRGAVPRSRRVLRTCARVVGLLMVWARAAGASAAAGGVAAACLAFPCPHACPRVVVMCDCAPLPQLKSDIETAAGSKYDDEFTVVKYTTQVVRCPCTRATPRSFGVEVKVPRP